MPRGVYERKPKGEKSAPAVSTKKAPIAKKAAPVKAKAKAAAAVAEPKSYSKSEKVASIGVAGVRSLIDLQQEQSAFMGFNILGANIATLSESMQRVAHDPELSTRVGKEIVATLDTLRYFREQVFAVKSAPVDEEPKVVDEEEEEEVLKAEAVTKAPAIVPAPPVAQAAGVPTLPQAPPIPPIPPSNNTFVPPAPPVLPQH